MTQSWQRQGVVVGPPSSTLGTSSVGRDCRSSMFRQAGNMPPSIANDAAVHPELNLPNLCGHARTCRRLCIPPPRMPASSSPLVPALKPMKCKLRGEVRPAGRRGKKGCAAATVRTQGVSLLLKRWNVGAEPPHSCSSSALTRGDAMRGTLVEQCKS